MVARSVIRLVPVMMATLYAIGLVFWTLKGYQSTGSRPGLGDPGAYLTMGLLGCAVLMSFMAQEWRINRLEEQVRSSANRAELVASSDRPRN